MFLYDDMDIKKYWTPIEPIGKQIQIGKTQNHLAIRNMVSHSTCCKNNP
jgi:hypothetical protein